MKRCLQLMMLVMLVSTTGCYWISGPWLGPDTVRDKFEDDIEIGMRVEELEDELGKPSEIIWDTDPDGTIPEGSRAGWWVYKYDYPADPIIIQVQADYEGIVTEKHLDDMDSAELRRRQKPKKPEGAYPGAPLKRFKELQKEKARGY
ncbi:MAG: hypothetical protein GWP05_03160 [Anaerolineaceae bacterium]|nr:hypothetical protein [Anaerolineaceae bacterium]